MRNDDLAYGALDDIRANPAEWDQGDFLCGTRACFAGHVVRRAAGAANEAETRAWLHAQYKAGNRWAIYTAEAAQHLLGWTSEEADTVFYSSTKDFEKLESLVKGILNGEGNSE